MEAAGGGRGGHRDSTTFQPNAGIFSVFLFAGPGPSMSESNYYTSVIFSKVCFLLGLGGSCKQVRRGEETGK